MWQLMTGGPEEQGEPRDPSQADYNSISRNAYLSKFGAPLPAIPAENSPQPTAENQMIPYGGRRTQLTQIEQPVMVGDFSDGRVRQVEGRLTLVEQSNRALLEEVVRLQGELKASHRRTEEALQAERQARQQLTENIRGSNDLVGQLGARLKRAEEKVADERTAVGALVNHTKQVEQAVLGSQQELVAKRDHQIAKIAELRNDLDEANRLREQLERATTTMVDELRQVKCKQDTHSIELNGTLHDVKDRIKRLEEEQRQVKMEHQRKNHENQHTSEQTASLLRSQLDARLGEVRDVLMDLRNRVTTEETERRQQDQTTQIRFNELQSQVHEQSRKRDESMNTLDVGQREREHAADNERLKMQGRVAEMAEEISRKILSKEIRLREEAQQKFANIEKYLHTEQAARITHEQAMREENEARWTALQKLTEDEVLHVREGQKLDRYKNVGNLSKMSEIVEKIEIQQVETKKQLEQVMKAEIKSRQSQDKQIEDKLEDVQDKLGVAISTLQQAIGGMREQVASTNNEYQDKMKALVVENSQGWLRGLADLDARMIGLQTKLTAVEESLEEKIQKIIKDVQDENEREESKKAIDAHQERLDEMKEWHETTEKKLKNIHTRIDELGPEIREMNRTNETIKEDMKALVDSEGKDRVRDVHMIRQEFTGKITELQTELDAVKQRAIQEVPAVIPISSKEKLAQGKCTKTDTKARIDSLEEEIKKNRKQFEEILEDTTKVDSSLQTVRVHLSRKIDNETKSRRNDIQDLQNLFEDLKTSLVPLLDQAAAIEEAMKRLDRKPSRETVSHDKKMVDRDRDRDETLGRDGRGSREGSKVSLRDQKRSVSRDGELGEAGRESKTGRRASKGQMGNSNSNNSNIRERPLDDPPSRNNDDNRLEEREPRQETIQKSDSEQKEDVQKRSVSPGPGRDRTAEAGNKLEGDRQDTIQSSERRGEMGESSERGQSRDRNKGESEPNQSNIEPVSSRKAKLKAARKHKPSEAV